MEDQFATRATWGTESRLAQLFGGQLAADGIKFSAGNPDSASFPTQEMNDAVTAAIQAEGAQIFNYQTVAGPTHLRTQLAQYLSHTAEIETDADHVLMTAGGQQAIDLVGKLLLDPGDHVMVEQPTYVGALAAFDQYAPTYHDIPMQPDGLDLDVLEATLKQTPQVKLLYTVPDFHNPTGVTMIRAKRQRLVALANQYDFYILEDTPYRELRYSGESLPAIKAFDTEDRVIFISSFSKILMPGLRLGWLVAGDAVLKQVRQLKETGDLESPALMMAAVSQFMMTHELSSHIQQLLPVYRQRLATMF